MIPKRKVVQIAVDADAVRGRVRCGEGWGSEALSRKVVQLTATDGWLYALCDDGTLWERVDGSWWQFSAPPDSTEGRSAKDAAQVADKAKE